MPALENLLHHHGKGQSWGFDQGFLSLKSDASHSTRSPRISLQRRLVDKSVLPARESRKNTFTCVLFGLSK